MDVVVWIVTGVLGWLAASLPLGVLVGRVLRNRGELLPQAVDHDLAA